MRVRKSWVFGILFFTLMFLMLGVVSAAVIAIGYGWGSYVGENSLIFLDKKNNLVSMKGMWPEVENMGVGLMRGC